MLIGKKLYCRPSKTLVWSHGGIAKHQLYFFIKFLYILIKFKKELISIHVIFPSVLVPILLLFLEWQVTLFWAFRTATVINQNGYLSWVENKTQSIIEEMSLCLKGNTGMEFSPLLEILSVFPIILIKKTSAINSPASEENGFEFGLSIHSKLKSCEHIKKKKKKAKKTYW